MTSSAMVEETVVARESEPLERFSPFHPEYRANPYAVYRTYSTHDPVHWGNRRQSRI